MNAYFSNSIKDICTSFQLQNKSQIDFLNGNTAYTFLNNFKPINYPQFCKIVKNLKKGSCIDNVNKTKFQDSMDEIGHHFCEIVNSLLKEGIMPDIFKKSEISLIPKVSGSINAEDQRGVHKLPIYEKIIELIVKDQLLEHLDRNDIIIKQQSGFRKSHSCETALNLLIEKVKLALDKNLVVVAVFLDFRRAFETINRKNLIVMLEHYGITGNSLKWFQSYLQNRYQCVKFNDYCSDFLPNEYGVPQGSVLGPILFIIYINDIMKAITKSEIKLFADDTVLYCSGKCLNDVINSINHDLESLSEWMEVKHLKLNVKKTVTVIFSTKLVLNAPPIYFQGEPIERVSCHKYLGVMLDEKLKFEDHTNYVLKKAGKKFGVLCRLNKSLTFFSKITIYKSIIAPHFEYCTTILFLLNQSQIYELQKLQNKCMRLILKCSYDTPIQSMLNCLGWLSIRQRIYLKTLIFIKDVKDKKVPEYLLDGIATAGENHSIATRRRDDFKLPSYRKSSSMNSLFYKGLKLFNDLPNSIKNCINNNQFKRLSIMYVKENVML